MEDFDVPQSKLAESAERVVDRALDEAKRREHALVTNEHIFLAFVQVEWNLFAEVMRDLGLNPHEIAHAIEEHLQLLPAAPGKRLRVSPATKLLFKLALLGASRSGRHVIEATDLFSALFEESQGIPVAIIRRHGIDPVKLTDLLSARMRDFELREERLKKRFELPPFLKHFATNLNQLARQGKLPPVFGRETELRQIMEILLHKERANSPVIIGEPGVGKTILAEGLAQMIEMEPEKVPPQLRECQIVNLQMNTMVAGTMLRGMFEDRIQNVIREVKERPNLILFVDEVHTMIGAGSALGAPSDAANIFKSVLSRGEVRIIGATTLSEYKEFIAEDEALARRFRMVFVDEQSLDEVKDIVYKVRQRLEKNYMVSISDEAIETAMELSQRYQRDKKSPDKQIGWLDTACVKASITKASKVTAAHVISAISAEARIPEDLVSRDPFKRLAGLVNGVCKRIVGQRPAVHAVNDYLTLNMSPLKDGFDRPLGVLMFLGPTGVGKTELAKALAEYLFGDEKRMIRIDMSEYQAEYANGGGGVDKLIGMPRGIVGSERGGILTNQLKDKPYSVVLLDEIEKAGSSVYNVFLQAFDDGYITDGRGKRVYLSDCIVIMTSNLGAEHFKDLTNPLGFGNSQPRSEDVNHKIMEEYNRRFTPEFRNRIDEVIIFNPLTEDEMRQIAVMNLERIKTEMARSGKTLVWNDTAVEGIIANGYSIRYGARFLKRTLTKLVKIPIAKSWTDSDMFCIRAVGKNVFIESELDEAQAV